VVKKEADLRTDGQSVVETYFPPCPLPPLCLYSWSHLQIVCYVFCSYNYVLLLYGEKCKLSLLSVSICVGSQLAHCSLNNCRLQVNILLLLTGDKLHFCKSSEICTFAKIITPGDTHHENRLLPYYTVRKSSTDFLDN
jgi:hypothetical protein